VKHPKFEGHVMPNEDEYQKSVWNLDIVLEYSLLITCIQAEEIDLEISNFRTFQISVTLTLDRVIRHTII